MSFDLTERQIKLLNAIIQEYSESSEPVGSKTVVKKYALKVSPATVRNEMAELLREGFLEMMHTSSGRIPTAQAFKFFIDEIMEEEEMPVLQEVAIKQRLWPQRFEIEKMLRQATRSLSEMTGSYAFVITSDGYLTDSGSANILEETEAWHVSDAKAVLELTDSYDKFATLLRGLSIDEGVSVAVGNELQDEKLNQAALVFSDFNGVNKEGFVGVFGPVRMKYASVIPCVRYTKNLIEELV